MRSSRLGTGFLALASSAVVMLASSAWASGPDRGRPFSWTGLYIGATVGGGWGESRFDDGAPSNPFDIDGFVGSAAVGYNLQLDRNWVVGIEADISSGISGGFGPGNLGQPNGGGWFCGSGACVTDVNWFGTVRGRIGYASSTLLVYGTGGLAYGRVESEIENSVVQVSDTSVGWTVGGGLEYAFAPNWSAKIEYLHVDLGWTRSANGFFFRSDAEFDVVRAGLNYRLGR